eukprot:CAMPEP_0201552904 /NCGR_PEP_ID=MMETSP0173_2-20130828/19267_1 /ASSEMBLY_ACC=CAM_ASM_000268 /TAXON_ID=218659 /ORGANISM="Vexillifera sp., Strain DIVA3 564/2" /LENGTH=341 /DNA_ID=CAMNT_0047963491 /DNA_START=119 /DNA_END=1145 /DNA_ORIENTATION=+
MVKFIKTMGFSLDENNQATTFCFDSMGGDGMQLNFIGSLQGYNTTSGQQVTVTFEAWNEATLVSSFTVKSNVADTSIGESSNGPCSMDPMYEGTGQWYFRAFIETPVPALQGQIAFGAATCDWKILEQQTWALTDTEDQLWAQTVIPGRVDEDAVQARRHNWAALRANPTNGTDVYLHFSWNYDTPSPYKVTGTHGYSTFITKKGTLPTDPAFCLESNPNAQSITNQADSDTKFRYTAPSGIYLGNFFNTDYEVWVIFQRSAAIPLSAVTTSVEFSESPDPPKDDSSSPDGLGGAAIAGIVFGVLLGVILIAGLGYWYYKRRTTVSYAGGNSSTGFYNQFD